MTNKSKTSLPTSPNNELELLKAQLAQLQHKIEDMADVESGNPVAEKKVQQDDYVSVMSLLPYNLNLSTKQGGQGNVKKFTKFGEVKQIMYKDLVDIMEVNSSFLEAGYFYILNPEIIRQHGLGEVYSRILTKEKIEDVMTSNSEECLTLYNSANDKQKEIIVELLTDKLRDEPEMVNLNVVDKISRASKVNITEKAEDARLLAKESEADTK
jgi:hypothetical protein